MNKREHMTMALLAILLVVFPFSVVYFLFGLSINLLQVICFVIIWPFSKHTYRRINGVLFELLWREVLWLLNWRAGLKIHIHMNPKTLQFMGKENALIIANQRSHIDFLFLLVLAQWSGCLNSTRFAAKSSIKFYPIIGWSLWFSEYMFLERSWAEDESKLNKSFKQIKDFPQPFWFGLFVEGTRFTKLKLIAAQQYASLKGLPIPRNVLIPRTKGFVSTVGNVRSFIPAIYDVTIIPLKDSPQPTVLNLFGGQSSVVHIYIKRHSMTDLPKIENDITQWCKNRFTLKDELLDKFITSNSFKNQELFSTIQPQNALMVASSWAFLLIFGGLKFATSFSSLWSWKGITFLFCFLTIIIMNLHTMFTYGKINKRLENPL